MLSIIPKPISIEEKPGFVEINPNSGMFVPEIFEKAAEFLSAELFGSEMKRCGEDEAQIKFLLNSKFEKEEYSICCDDRGIIVEASCFSGAFYGVQTLKQILFFAKKSGGKVSVPYGNIKDKPRYAHRGLLFDVSRHFFPKAEIKRLIDLMAMYKLNVLHWHLTDDQGWRVEIKKYPLLTEIGSKRKDSSTRGWHRTDLEGKSHEGYYTQDDIREIVAYAGERNITVIPEIDMPAHFAAAMASYNYLGCREIPCEVHWFCGAAIPKKMKMEAWNRSACAGKESTYRFIFDVIDELVQLFPAPYFHIGGDEAPKDEWKNCPHCQQRMKENGIETVEGLQGYFNNRIAQHLKEKGKNLVVWNEALGADNLDSSVLGQYWTLKKDKNVKKHIKKGGKIIISKHQSFYFDMGYNQYPLKNTYNFEALDGMIDPEDENSVLGIEGTLWTEWVADREKMDMQLFPRVQALAEVSWVQRGKKDFPQFLQRVHKNNEILDAMGVNYAEDKISMPGNLLKRRFEISNWYYNDQYREVRQNREEKLKK